MSRVAYVAGQYLPHRQAAVHIEDRGYQFGDGVYEVIAVTGGHLVDEGRHLARLHRSLTELRINQPMSDSALKIVIREVVRRNGVDTGIVYLQVTRGVAPRDHAFPKAAKPVLVVTSRRSLTASRARSAASCAMPISVTLRPRHERAPSAERNAMPAGDSVRLGQHPRRQLGDDPRRVEFSDACHG